MGKLARKQLTPEELEKVPTLAVYRSIPLLSRASDITIDPNKFNSSKIMMNLGHAAKSNLMVRDKNPNKKTDILVRGPRDETTLDSIILHVLGVTHRDLEESELDGLKNNVIDYSSAIEIQTLFEPHVIESIEDKTASYRKADLLRGMQVFSEVANNRYDYVYEADILRPARLLARYMVMREIEPTN